MTQSMLQVLANARTARVDPPRYNPRTGLEEARVRVRFRVRPTMQVLPGGVLGYAEPSPGVFDNVAEMYESEAADLLKLVEDATPEQLAEVERDLERQLDAIHAKHGPDMGPPLDVNFYASFERILKRSIRPVIEAEILGPVTKPRP